MFASPINRVWIGRKNGEMTHRAVQSKRALEHLRFKRRTRPPIPSCKRGTNQKPRNGCHQVRLSHVVLNGRPLQGIQGGDSRDLVWFRRQSISAEYRHGRTDRSTKRIQFKSRPCKFCAIRDEDDHCYVRRYIPTIREERSMICSKHLRERSDNHASYNWTPLLLAHRHYFCFSCSPLSVLSSARRLASLSSSF